MESHTMKKQIILFTFLLAVFTLSGCQKDSKESPHNSQKIIVGTSADNPPFEFLKDGKVVGFDIALMTEIGKQLNMDIEIKDMNFDGILGSLTSKRIDAAIAGLSATNERKKAMDFTQSYHTSTISMVFLKDSAGKSESDISNKSVGVQAGTMYEAYANGDLHQKVSSYTVKSLPRIPDLIQDLKSGRIVCIISGTAEAMSIETNHPGTTSLVLQEDPGFAIALPKGSPLTEKINVAIDALKKNGKIAQLQNEWLKSSS